MKLPENKKERTQVLVLIGLGIVAVCFGIITGIVKPLVAKKKANQEKIQKLTSDIAKARGEIRQMEQVREANVAVMQEITEAADRATLRPRLGNYLLSAREVVQRHAAAANLELKSVEEVGILDLPRGSAGKGKAGSEKERASADRKGTAATENPTPKAGKETEGKEKEPDPAFKSYVARVTLTCGFSELLDLTRGIEVENPYLCISQLSVSADPKEPTLHKIAFNVQWPIWADPELEQSLRQQLEGMETK